MKRTVLFVLMLVLLIGLSPMSSHHMFAMQTTRTNKMMMVQQNNMLGGNTAGESSTGSCCDEIAQSFMGCAFLVLQEACIVLSGGNERVGYSTPLIQSSFIETLAPPPKA